MGQPYIGEIRIFAGNFPPAGWAFCDGTPVAISENDALFTLIGTTYGGDGESTFNLPDLRGRLPVHQGTGDGGTYIIGQTGGVESVTLSTQQIPSHNHAFLASTSNGSASTPIGNVLGTGTSVTVFRPSPSAPTTPMAASELSAAGGSQPHDNMQPYLCLNFIISLFGIFPHT